MPVDERGQQYTPPNHGKTVIEKAWDELDSYLDSLVKAKARSKEPDFSDDEVRQLHETIGWCRALAWSIHTWVPHWYRTPDEVTRQAMKRRKMRFGEIEWEPTPGYQYNPIPSSHESLQKPKRPHPKQQPLPFTPLSEKDKTAIKTALKNGLRVDTLASVYGVTEWQIKELA